MKNVKRNTLIGIGVLSGCALLTLVGVNNSPKETAKVEAVSTKSKNNEPNYLKFTSLEDDSKITIGYESVEENSFWASYDGETFDIQVSTNSMFTLNKDDVIYFKANNIKTNKDNHFSITGKVESSGSVTSLTDSNGSDPDVTLSNYCYSYMFYQCDGLVNAPELPANTLADHCYAFMFEYCHNLTVAQETLPAMNLAPYCYTYMFATTYITESPVLPAETMAEGCYTYMFYNCNSLTVAPELPAMNLAGGCYVHMFGDCSKLVNAPELPATTLAYSCYCAMFENCTSLVYAPTLPVVNNLLDQCYSAMFKSCSSLEVMPTLNVLTSENSSCNAMFYHCPKLKVYDSPREGYTRAISFAAATKESDYPYHNIFYNTGGDVSEIGNEGGTFYVRDVADYWSETFYNSIKSICDESGERDKDRLKKAWDLKANDYNKLSDADKSLIVDAEASLSGTNIQKAVHYYDYCTAKYEDYCSKFMTGRTPKDTNPVISKSNSELAISLAVITSLISVSVIGCYFFVKKKSRLSK